MRNDSVTHPIRFSSLISVGLMLACFSDVQAQLQLGISFSVQPLVTINGLAGAVVEASDPAPPQSAHPARPACTGCGIHELRDARWLVD